MLAAINGDNGASLGRYPCNALQPILVTAAAVSDDLKYNGLDVPDVALTNLDMERVITPLGPIDFLELPGRNLSNGNLWFQFETTRQGQLSIEAISHGATKA